VRTGELVYFISHNIAREEVVDGNQADVGACARGRRGRSPSGHHGAGGVRLSTGYRAPDPVAGRPAAAGSAVMVAEQGAELELLQHQPRRGAGAGPQSMRSARWIRRGMDNRSFVSQGHSDQLPPNYPKDEAPAAYKDFGEVVRSVERRGAGVGWWPEAAGAVRD
jgi:tRNA-splicing ligase RtcB